MKILSSKAHGVIDYIFVLFLALSPSLFHLSGLVATITYALAGVHLLMTILTNFELGLVHIIPFRVHGFIELAVAIGLGALSLWFRERPDATGFYYFAALAVTILVVFNITDFRSTPQ